MNLCHGLIVSGQRYTVTKFSGAASTTSISHTTAEPYHTVHTAVYQYHADTTVKTRRAPSRHCRDASVYGRTLAYVHAWYRVPPPPPPPPPPVFGKGFISKSPVDLPLVVLAVRLVSLYNIILVHSPTTATTSPTCTVIHRCNLVTHGIATTRGYHVRIHLLHLYKAINALGQDYSTPPPGCFLVELLLSTSITPSTGSPPPLVPRYRLHCLPRPLPHDAGYQHHHARLPR